MIKVEIFRNVFDPTSRESIAVPCLSPMLLEDLLPSDMDFSDPTLVLTVDGVGREGGVVNPGQQLVIVQRPAFTAAVLWQLLFSVIMMAVSIAISSSMMDDEPPVEEDNEGESFQGFRNSYFTGGAIPLVFGERRIAPPVVGQIIESAFAAWSLSNRETMRLLLVLGHGPIEGLGTAVGSVADHDDWVEVTASGILTPSASFIEKIGLKINGQSASNFTDVFAEWRTGEMTQTPIAGFPDSSVDAIIAQTVNEYSDSIDITDLGYPSGILTPGNEIDDTLGESLVHTMVDVADRYVLTLTFKKGIYADVGGGGTAPSTASFRLQFWPVDAVGTRTGDTVLLPEINITGESTVGQTINIPGGLFSPQSYTPSTQLGYLNALANTRHAKVSAPINASTFPDSFADRDKLKFSAACWVRPKAEDVHRLKPIFLTKKGALLTGAGAGWPYYVRASGVSNSGMMFALERVYAKPFGEPDFVAGDWQLAIYTWIGATSAIYYSPPIGLTTAQIVDNWLHCGVSWDGTLGQGTPTFYLNGQAMSGSFQGPDSVKPAMFEAGDMLIGTNGATLAGGQMDNSQEVDLVDLAISNGVRDVNWIWQGFGIIDPSGNRLTAYAPAQDSQLVFVSKLSEEIASGKIEQLAFPLSTTVGEVVETVGAVLQAAPQVESPLWYAPSGLALRGRYHLELYRSNAALDDPGTEVNVAEWDAVTFLTDEDFSHPGVAKLAVSVDGDEQISDSRPNISVLERGVLVPVWNGNSSEYPVFETKWTRNPAWCAYYICTEEEVALGAIFGHTGGVNLEAWKVWADYCDEGVDDAAGVPAFFDGDFVSASPDHLFGEVHFKISLLDASGVTTGEIIPKTWVVGHTLKIVTASDASWLVASADLSARLTITSMQYQSDDAAPLGSQHWLQVELDWVIDYTLPTALNVTGTATGVEARHELDAIFDTKDADGWDELLTIMRASRASAVIIGNNLSVFVDRARDVDFFITQAQMEVGSLTFSWASVEDRHNSIELEYVDRNQDYELDTVQEDHPTISGEVGAGKIRKAPPRFLKGVVRRTEVRRQAIFRLNQWQLLNHTCRFKLGVDGLGLAAGDHIRIAHDVPYIGTSGRVFVDGSATVVRIDRDVIVTFGKTYELELRSSGFVDVDGKELREVVAIDATMVPGSGSVTLAAGSGITLASPGFQTLVPEQGDVYSFGETGLTAEDFTVTVVTINPKTMIRTVECITYNADTFLDNEFGILPPDPLIELPRVRIPNDGSIGFGGGAQRPGDSFGLAGGQVLAARETTFLGAGGKPEMGVTLSWPKTSYGVQAAGGTSVWSASLTDGATPTPRRVGHAPAGSTSLKISGEQFRAGQVVRFYIQHLNIRGEGRSSVACPSFDMVVGARARVFAHGAPTVLAPKSRQAHAVYPIQFPDGQTPEGVEVRVGGWIMGQKVAHSLRDGDLASDQWVSGAFNVSGDEAYQHQVRSLLPSGQVSAAATFVNEDPLPLGMTAESDIAHEDAWGSGTLTGLQITSGYLEFSAGSHLEGTFESPALDLGSACRWLLEIAAEAVQKHPTVIADMNEPIDSRVYANWLIEGPTGGDDVEMCRLSLEWLPSDTATLPGITSWAVVRPGEVYFRKAQFRVRVTRPRVSFNCKINRFGVRVLKLPAYQPTDIDGGTF